MNIYSIAYYLRLYQGYFNKDNWCANPLATQLSTSKFSQLIPTFCRQLLALESPLLIKQTKHIMLKRNRLFLVNAILSS